MPGIIDTEMIGGFVAKARAICTIPASAVGEHFRRALRTGKQELFVPRELGLVKAGGGLPPAPDGISEVGADGVMTNADMSARADEERADR